MKGYLKALLILAMISSFPAQANIFSYISKVENVSGGIPGLAYIGQIERWTPMPGVANPCYNVAGCEVYVAHRHYANGTAGTYSSRDPKIADASKYKTMDELREAFLKITPLPYTFRVVHSGTVVTAECVGIFYGQRRSASDPLLPGSICGAAPSPDLVCDFNVENIDFNYNQLAYNDVLNNNANVTKQTKSVKIQCNYNSKVIISATTNDDGAIWLNEENTLQSILKINNKPANELFELPIANKETASRYTNSFTLSSELKSVGKPKSGPFRGSAVIVIVVL